MRAWIVIMVVASLASCGPPQSAKPVGEKSDIVAPAGEVAAPDPIPAVRPIYDNYVSGARTVAEGYYEPPLSAGLKQLWDQFKARSEQPDFEGTLDFDPYVLAQDYLVTNVQVSVATPPANGACTLLARFTNIGKPMEVYYDMVLEDGAWRIDNVRAPASDNMDLRRILSAG